MKWGLFDSADQVIVIDSFHPKLVKARAKQIVQDNSGRKNETSKPLPKVQMRNRSLSALDFSRGKKTLRD
jgi:hypothetical protein